MVLLCVAECPVCCTVQDCVERDSETTQDLVSFLEPEQLVLSKGGAVDLKNAFNEVHRAAIIENLEDEPSLQHLAWFAAVSLVPEVGLENGGVLWGKAKEGETQGDPKAGAVFCFGIQPEVRELCREVREAEGVGVFGMDDDYVAGPAEEVVFPAVERFERRLLERCGLVLQRAKTEVFSWNGVLPRDTPAGMVLAGREGEFLPGYRVLWSSSGQQEVCSPCVE